ncbi:hypothetical protein BAUCODRAFT_33217 [Baudoinia panamericana UAMH 10762]|uniref:PNK FHA domain-containing protein n=1 Tax=Baudoinia panamericana (strain UAMH 10762) TaxID=717646 RepID=M2MLI2_BAUPA|nr:uncharacterized protein BAUCODRAFT_33217 [Baudoinia panamericana UAMH 10762]EMC97501.1 hypothetical protein BAUCODRAFT_33217 [Baudoinia panamericana UAMH 10762]
MPPSTLKRVTSTDRDVSPPPAKRRAVATTAANFFTPTSQKAPEKVTFHVLHDTLLVGRYNERPTISKLVKIAAFDFDDTLVMTKSKNRFARGADDWQWWHTTVPSRLKKLHQDGYVIVVMSNQAAVSLRPTSKTPKEGMRSLNNLKGRVTAVLNALDLPITVYAATDHDIFRKPRPGMWEQMLRDHGLLDAGDIDHEKCIFVGDAAGREADKAAGIRKDHSCCDRDFAANVNMPFRTPEEYFLGERVKPFVRGFDPAAYVASRPTSEIDRSNFAKKHDVEIVLLCGSPGAGKSTFYWQHLQPLGYERVNQDILKTREKCMKVAAEYVSSGHSVAVDNTNADIETRAAWVGLSKQLKVPIRLVHFTASAKLCEHNDTVRALAGDLMNPEKRTMLPKLAFTGYAARYREPKVEEGFDDITENDFKFEGSEAQKAQWVRYWVS